MRKDNTVGIISTIATIFIFIVMSITLYCQKGFNQKQIEFNQRVLHLTEASAVPLIFAVFDSLGEPRVRAHNVFYSIKNVGSTPALKLRSVCSVDTSGDNPLRTEVPDTGVVADLFPTQSKSAAARRGFSLGHGLDTLYFHVRIDYEDMLDYSYYYRATHLIFVKHDSVRGGWKLEKRMKWSEFKALGKK